MAMASEENDVFANELTPTTGPEDTVVRTRNTTRRSSIIIDSSRRRQSRKKTVSFSQMPHERKVVTGNIVKSNEYSRFISYPAV